MQSFRRTLLLAGPALLMARWSAGAEKLDAPNFAEISPYLASSGQPTEAALRQLAAKGFQAVVYLAPSTVANAVRNEPEILSAQGVEFVHIPIPFDAPEGSHVQAVFTALDRLRDRKTLVHCEVNMRASVMVFLYRAIRLREDPATAYEAVARVWSPRGVWRRLLVAQLALANVPFEPY